MKQAIASDKKYYTVSVMYSLTAAHQTGKEIHATFVDKYNVWYSSKTTSRQVAFYQSARVVNNCKNSDQFLAEFDLFRILQKSNHELSKDDLIGASYSIAYINIDVEDYDDII